MIFDIKSIVDGKIFFSHSAESLKSAIEAVVKGGANLRNADLTWANLTGANLRRTDWTGTCLSTANLSEIRHDIWAVLRAAPEEVPVLRQAIIDGTIDGTVYEGDCACLIGTLAKSRHCLYNQIHGLVPNEDRPAERFFLGIRPGDTPENSQLSALVMAWIDQFLEKKIA